MALLLLAVLEADALLDPTHIGVRNTGRRALLTKGAMAAALFAQQPAAADAADLASYGLSRSDLGLAPLPSPPPPPAPGSKEARELETKEKAAADEKRKADRAAAEEKAKEDRELLKVKREQERAKKQAADAKAKVEAQKPKRDPNAIDWAEYGLDAKTLGLEEPKKKPPPPQPKFKSKSCCLVRVHLPDV